MSSKLTKIFSHEATGDQIRISCNYDCSLGEISNVKVIVMDAKTGRGIDMTNIWEQEPFLSLVDDINWSKIECEKSKTLEGGADHD